MATKLSIILCARNDNYCGNPIERLNIALNHAAVVLEDEDYEIKLTDWGSDVPISEACNISDEARENIEFIYVPKDVTSSFDTPFSEVHALNCAARKCTGDFIGRIDQDILIGSSFVDWYFSDAPHMDTVYFCDRRDMEEGQPYATYLDTPYEVGGGWRSRCEFWQTYVGLFLVPREAWHSLRGYDEKHMWKDGMEREFIVRLKRDRPLENLAEHTSIPYDFYHLWHPRDDNKGRKKNSRKYCVGLDEKRAIPLVPNNEDWGLRDLT